MAYKGVPNPPKPKLRYVYLDHALRQWWGGKAMLRGTLAALLFTSGIAQAADITLQIDPPASRAVIRIGGEFHKGDHKKFIELALKCDDALVVFDESTGGSLERRGESSVFMRLFRLMHREMPRQVAPAMPLLVLTLRDWLSAQRLCSTSPRQVQTK
jgi:hypothetical protein